MRLRLFDNIGFVAANNNKIEYADKNIFYTVGLPIKIQTYGFWGFSPRKKIPNEEIIESISEQAIGNKKLRLFRTEEEALNYSRYLRDGIGFNGGKPAEEVTQPAIFKVIYLSDVSSIIFSTEKLIINQFAFVNTIENSDETNPFYDSSPFYDARERKVNVEYFEVARNEIKPLTGQLKLHCGPKGNFILHDIVDFDDLHNEDECRLM